MSYVKGFSLLFLTAFFLISASALAQWEYMGLGEYSPGVIKHYQGVIYVGTDNGIYTKDVSSVDTNWVPIGPPEKQISTFLVRDPQIIIASIVMSVGDEAAILLTNDGGATWEPYQNGYGGTQTLAPTALEASPVDPDVLYAGGQRLVIARSGDFGLNWTPVYAGWGFLGGPVDFIHIDTTDPDIIWAGGITALSSSFFLKSTSLGDPETWVSPNYPLEQLGRMYDIAVNPADNDICFAACGSILKTTNGLDFEYLADDPEGGSVFVEIDPQHPDILYATGNPVTIAKTFNGGQSWTIIPEPQDVTLARDMLLLKNGNGNVIYISAYNNDGVYRYIDPAWFVCGDLNDDGQINVLDILFFIAYKFQQGSAPVILEAADVNGDGDINVLDILYMIAYKFQDGSELNCLY